MNEHEKLRNAINNYQTAVASRHVLQCRLEDVGRTVESTEALLAKTMRAVVGDKIVILDGFRYRALKGPDGTIIFSANLHDTVILSNTPKEKG